MTIDGAILDKPQIGPAFDESPGRKFDRAARELYIREHYLPITNSGGLEVAYSFDQMIYAINDALDNPEKNHDGRKNIIEEISTFDDGNASDRVYSALLSFIDQ